MAGLPGQGPVFRTGRRPGKILLIRPFCHGRGWVVGGMVTEGLLAGERVLWTGRPARAGVRLADVGWTLYAAAALAALAGMTISQWHTLPSLLQAFMLVVAVGAVIQVGAMAVYPVMIRPRLARGMVYEITDYRVLVTAGLRTRCTSSVYLDQISEPVVKRNRDGSGDLVLRAGAGLVTRRILAGTASGAPFSALGGGLFAPAGGGDLTVLRTIADADQAQQIAVAARRRLLDRQDPPVPAPGAAATGPLPAGVVLEPGERVLWAGGPVCVPWWFGGYDRYLSAFGLMWLTCVSLMAALSVTSGSAAVLIFLVPFAAVGGLYPAAGRVIHRRLRIRRSAYVVTSQRLITSWRLGGQPVTVSARLGELLPPAIRWQAIFTDPAAPRKRGPSDGWRNLPWPASTPATPVLIGVADAPAVRDLIASAQLALRAAAPPAAREPTPAAPQPS